MTGNLLFSSFVSGETHPLILPVMILLFLIWLVHRLERRAVEDAIYRNFPFFKEAVNGFQQKLNNVDLRLEGLENRINRLEKNIQVKKDAF